tara:strand:- start:4692 stop:4877 length:186 start_codon:yes stop_codon:yes gene_type:complete
MNDNLKSLIKEILNSSDDDNVLATWKKITTGYETKDIIEAHSKVSGKLLEVLSRRISKRIG